MEELILGVDGGGTKTAAVVADENGVVLGRGIAGASNMQAVGFKPAMQALGAAIQSAFTQAQIHPRQAQILCLGMAGAARPADRDALLGWSRTQQWAEQIEVLTDAELLLWAGTPEGWGVGCVAGTGSIVFGVDPGGNKARAGGWGYILGDEGSGYAIGLAALRAVTRAADLRTAPTALTQLVLNAWAIKEPAGLIPVIYGGGVEREQIASLAVLVAQAAQAGDPAAEQIIVQAARELCQAMTAVIQQLGLMGNIPCALGGGVLVNLGILREQVIAGVSLSGAVLDPVMVVSDPVQGAVRLALRRLAQRA